MTLGRTDRRSRRATHDRLLGGARNAADSQLRSGRRRGASAGPVVAKENRTKKKIRANVAIAFIHTTPLVQPCVAKSVENAYRVKHKGRRRINGNRVRPNT